VGGGCKKWEEPDQAMAREVLEELGWRIPRDQFRKMKVYGAPGRIAAFRDGSVWRMVIVVFHLDIPEERPIRISSESKEARFFSKDEVRNLEIAVTHTDIVQECFLEM
jgi:8-oxo-dGTP pyrophosphatase MutT (NUDIX family)